MSAPTVYTYWQPVPGFEYPKALLDLWSKSWEARGWKTAVLCEANAHDHPGYAYFNERISRFPTSNPREYERACFLRHLAMAQIGGGLLMDYDCILRSKALPEDDLPLPNHPVFLEPTRVPCAVMGSADAYEELCDWLCEYDASKDRHVSDMTILRKTNYQAQNVCVEHLCSGRPVENDPGDGWKTAPMIHFSTFSFSKLGWTGDKAQMIQRVLATL
jgi:hypothetical protein